MAPIDRRSMVKITGSSLLAGGAVSGLEAGSAVAGSDPVEYTLTVTDSSGEEVGSVTVTDEFPIEEYGNRISFRIVGDYPGDGDTAVIDNVRGDGEVVENWSTRDLDDYTLVDGGTGAEYSLVSDPTTDGDQALRINSGQTTAQLQSDQELLPVEPGAVLSGDLRHETDNSGTYAMRSSVGFGVGGTDDIIEVSLGNPGSQRESAGIRIRTPNNKGWVDFTPELGEFYSFTLEIGGSAIEFDASPSLPRIDEDVTFEVTETDGDVDTYEWGFGDGTSATGEAVTYSYDERGEYDVTLTIVRPDGDEESTTETIEVGTPEVVLTREQTTVKSPVTAQVIYPTEDGYEYHWQVNEKPDGSQPKLLHGENYPESRQPEQSAEKPHAALKPDQAGEYELLVEVFDNGGESVGNETVTVTVQETELAELGWDIDGADTVSEIVELYAPNYNFHEDENYFPTRYEAFSENAEALELAPYSATTEDLDASETNQQRLIEVLLDAADDIEDLIDASKEGFRDWIADNFEDETLAESPSLYDLGEITEPEPDQNRALYLFGDEPDYQEYQSRYPRTIHANVHTTSFEPESGMFEDDDEASEKDYLAITYWTFYVFDPKNEGDVLSNFKAFVASHASDTETVTILIDEDGPQWVGAAQHYSGEYMQWEKVAGTDGPTSIDIYPARGAHSSYLVNTDEYDSTIPGQVRFLPSWLPGDDSTQTLLGQFSDKTESARRWSHGDTTNDNEYDLIVLTGDEPWGEFTGEFLSDNGISQLEGGVLAQQRKNRFNDVGEWLPNRMIPEPEVLNTGRNWSVVVPSIGADLQTFRIRFFRNPGNKPHTFVTDATVTTKNALGEEVDTISTEVETDLGWFERTTIEIPFDDIDVPTAGTVTVDAEVLTYPSDIATDADVLYETNQQWPIADPPDIDLPDVLTAEAGDGTVAPGDTVERTVPVENTGEDPTTVLVTLTAIDPDGTPYVGEPDSYETISIDPGESAEATVSWTPDVDVLEGEYDLLVEVWNEPDFEDRLLLLGEQTESNAVTVEKPRGTLSVSTIPADAAVFLDDEPLTESTVEQPVGSYEITAFHKGYESATESVTIEEGEPTTVDLELTEDDLGVESYTNDNGIIGLDGVRTAVEDWQADRIETSLLRTVIDAWASGEPIE